MLRLRGADLFAGMRREANELPLRDLRRSHAVTTVESVLDHTEKLCVEYLKTCVAIFAVQREQNIVTKLIFKK